MLFASSAGGLSSGPIVLLGVVLTLVVVSIFQRRAERRAMFKACAIDLGAQLVEAGTDRFTATIRGLRLDVELAAGGKDSPDHTCITVKAAAPFALVLYLRLRTAGEERPVQKGDAVDIIVGDSVLDAAWVIEGAPRERVVRMLDDPALRTKLRALRGVNEPRVAVEDDHVVVSRNDFDTHGTSMALERIELALTLAAAAVAESARGLPQKEGAADYRTAARRPDGRGERAQIEALARVRASREIVKARRALVLGQLAAPGFLLFVSMTMRKGAFVPALALAVMWISQVLIACTLGGPYLKLLQRLKRGTADHVAIVVMGMANVFLVSQIVSALLR